MFPAAASSAKPGTNFADFASNLAFMQDQPGGGPGAAGGLRYPSYSNDARPGAAGAGAASAGSGYNQYVPQFVSGLWGGAPAPPAQPPSSRSFLFSDGGASDRTAAPATPSSFVGKAASSVFGLRDRAAAAVTGAQDSVQTTMSRWMYFAVSFIFGAFLLFLAFAFLPMVVFAPQKFALLFTLGSCFLINSLGLLHGYGALVKHFTAQRDRVLISGAYILSLGATLAATLFVHNYLVTLLCAMIQLCCLVVLLMSYLAGSSRTLGMVQSMALSMLQRICPGLGVARTTVLPI